MPRRSTAQIPTGQFSKPKGGASNNLYNLADFMMGARNSYALASFAPFVWQQRMHFGYVQDDVRLTSTLTLNLGLRYEFATPVTERTNKLANFDPTTNTLVNASNGSLFNRALVHPDYHDFAPRVGFAATLDPNTVLRGGYAINYVHFEPMGRTNLLLENGPFIVNASITQVAPHATSGSPQAQCANDVQDQTKCFRTTQQGYPPNFASSTYFSTLTSTVNYIPQHTPTTNLQTYNLALQHSLGHHTSLEIAYVALLHKGVAGCEGAINHQ